jgi:hypothetical protein
MAVPLPEVARLLAARPPRQFIPAMGGKGTEAIHNPETRNPASTKDRRK